MTFRVPILVAPEGSPNWIGRVLTDLNKLFSIFLKETRTADTAVTNAYIAADTAVTNAYIAADTAAISAAATAAAAGVVNELHVGGPEIWVQSQKLTAIRLHINDVSTQMQHKITAHGTSGTASNYAGAIKNASETLAVTQAGTDSSTAMTAGGKIGSANTNRFYLDTDALVQNKFIGIASIAFNSTGTNLTCQPHIDNLNINGTTQLYLGLRFYDTATGAAYALTSVPTDKDIIVDLMMFVPDT